MPAALIVDWDDLLQGLRHARLAHDAMALAEALRAKSEEVAGPAQRKLERFEVYGSLPSFETLGNQQYWVNAGFRIHVASPGRTNEEVYVGALGLRTREGFDFFVLAAGKHDYSLLAGELQRGGGVCYLWDLRSVTQKRSSSWHFYMPKLLQLKETDAAPTDTKIPPSQLEGVIKVIEGEIIRRTKAQLTRDARKNTPQEVAKALDRLAEKIRADNFIPDAIVGWTPCSGSADWIDELRHWHGSETVARELCSRLGAPAFLMTIREEGEKREVLSISDVPTGVERVLAVDDAAFSGRTLDMMADALAAGRPGVQVRSAVVSAKEPVAPSVSYYGNTHQSDDVLFPWGWGRAPNKFNDLLRSLGTKDKRWILRSLDQSGVEVMSIVEDQVCSLHLISNSSAPETATCDCTARTEDELIYVVSGSVSIEIEAVRGSFEPNEFLFVPRVIPYRMEIGPNAAVLRIFVKSRERGL